MQPDLENLQDGDPPPASSCRKFPNAQAGPSSGLSPCCHQAELLRSLYLSFEPSLVPKGQRWPLTRSLHITTSIFRCSFLREAQLLNRTDEWAEPYEKAPEVPGRWFCNTSSGNTTYHTLPATCYELTGESPELEDMWQNSSRVR